VRVRSAGLCTFFLCRCCNSRSLDATPMAILQQAGSVGHYSFVRKAASDVGWDWGPAFVPSGIPGPVELLGYAGTALTGAGEQQAWCMLHGARPCAVACPQRAALLEPSSGHSNVVQAFV
jgi:hypothetical protein